MKTNHAFAALASLLALTTTAPAAEKLNTKLGAFNGINCYSNGISGRWTSKDPINSVTVTYTELDSKGRPVTKKKTITTGYQWQCVEYGKRFFAGTKTYDIGNGDACYYYGNAKAKGLTACPDGGGILPAVGDLLCWGGGSGSLGHVAIVREVGANYVRVIEQNRLCDFTDGDHKIGMTVTKDSKGKVTRVTVDPKGVNSKGGYWTQGWLRK